MKDGKEVTELLKAFDFTESYRAAAELVGCDHHTVAHHVARRDAGFRPGMPGLTGPGGLMTMTR